MRHRNLGKIKISRNVIDNELGVVIKVFSILKLIPVKTEWVYDADAVEYTAISDRFDELPENTIIPEYKIIIKADGNGDVVNVDVEKKEWNLA